MPYRFLFPAIMAFSAIGIYSVNNSSFEIYLTALFGVIGFIWIKLGCSPAPMLLGFVLGPMMEEHLRRAMLMSKGDPSVFVTAADQPRLHHRDGADPGRDRAARRAQPPRRDRGMIQIAALLSRYFFAACVAGNGSASASFNRSGSTLTSMPARSCSSIITTRESRPAQPRFIASVISA